MRNRIIQGVLGVSLAFAADSAVAQKSTTEKHMEQLQKLNAVNPKMLVKRLRKEQPHNLMDVDAKYYGKVVDEIDLSAETAATDLVALLTLAQTYISAGAPEQVVDAVQLIQKVAGKLSNTKANDAVLNAVGPKVVESLQLVSVMFSNGATYPYTGAD